MKPSTLQPEERERRLRVIEAGVHEEFWRILRDSLLHWNAVKMQEVIELHMDGKHEEAEKLAILIQARQQIVEEPTLIIRSNKPIFDKFVITACEKCGSVLKKLKQIFKDENTNHGGNNANT